MTSVDHRLAALEQRQSMPIVAVQLLNADDPLGDVVLCDGLHARMSRDAFLAWYPNGTLIDYCYTDLWEAL